MIKRKMKIIKNKKSQEEFDKIDIWETDFDKEVEERWLEDLDLSKEGMKNHRSKN